MFERILAEWFEECLDAYRFRTTKQWRLSQKRIAIELMLRANPHRSDRSLAKRTGFSRELIAKTRRRLPRPAYRTGLDGKQYRRLRSESPEALGET